MEFALDNWILRWRGDFSQYTVATGLDKRGDPMSDTPRSLSRPNALNGGHVHTTQRRKRAKARLTVPQPWLVGRPVPAAASMLDNGDPVPRLMHGAEVLGNANAKLYMALLPAEGALRQRR